MLEYAPNLEVLHLPIANNVIVTSVSGMKSLRVFKCDRKGGNACILSCNMSKARRLTNQIYVD